MKKLILLRHAKSSWKDLSLDDFDRPLNKRGKHDAPIMAEYLKQQNIAIEKIFSSSAKRARKTAAVFSGVLGVEAVFLDELYDTSIEKLLNFINRSFKQHDMIAIVSHNPELTELSNFLSSNYIDNIPTSGYVVLECSATPIQNGSCELVDFIYPKKLSSL